MAILLILSTIIATAGLISDSAAVVIGAMLVAPLMSPVMAAAGAVVTGWSGRFYGCWCIACNQSKKKRHLCTHSNFSVYFIDRRSVYTTVVLQRKIIFNAQYRAAKSEILQDWLKESELELVDVDILRERRTLYMSLEGPTPPVNIGELHDELIAAQAEDQKTDFKIKYTWTQKVTGVWPQEARSIREVAERADASVTELTKKPGCGPSLI